MFTYTALCTQFFCWLLVSAASMSCLFLNTTHRVHAQKSKDCIWMYVIKIIIIIMNIVATFKIIIINNCVQIFTWQWRGILCWPKYDKKQFFLKWTRRRMYRKSAHLWYIDAAIYSVFILINVIDKKVIILWFSMWAHCLYSADLW